MKYVYYKRVIYLIKRGKWFLKEGVIIKIMKLFRGCEFVEFELFKVYLNFM